MTIRLTIDITTNGESIVGIKERIAYLLEGIGKVRVVKVEGMR